MRLHLLMAVATGLSLTHCTFSGIGLGEAGDLSSTSEPTASDASTSGSVSGDPTTDSTDPTTGGGGDLCGNAQPNPGEECDNGADNNGKFGSVCRADCKMNVCGDGYLASIEGCDDGNTIDGDGCSAMCVGEGCGDGKVDPATEECDDKNKIDDDACTNKCKLPVCGDGIKNADEECEDGNQEDTDACTNACKNAVCGDNIVQMGVEACDDGNQVDDDDCSNQCALASCGDGIKTADEECDDGNNTDGDGCSALCKNPACGDGIKDPGEECDAGADNGDTKACTAACKAAVCGDKLVQEGVEECDDGNMIDADDCRNGCILAECGDGVINKANNKETCDDGNTDPGDGCSATCIKECGNGVIDPGEECDDKANGDLGDSCDPQCNRLRYYVFVTSAKAKADFKGVDQADMTCNTLATAAKLPGAGNYKAWISGKDPGKTPDLRLFHSDRPYIMLNKAKVADDWIDLTDGSLDSAITRTEANMALPAAPANCMAMDVAEALVWTGSAADGTALGGDCEDWTMTSKDMSGGIGLINKKDGSWTQACDYPCDAEARFYCFEQPPP